MAWYFSSWEHRYCTALGMVSPLHSMSSLQILGSRGGGELGDRGPGAGAGASSGHTPNLAQLHLPSERQSKAQLGREEAHPGVDTR